MKIKQTMNSYYSGAMYFGNLYQVVTVPQTGKINRNPKELVSDIKINSPIVFLERVSVLPAYIEELIPNLRRLKSVLPIQDLAQSLRILLHFPEILFCKSYQFLILKLLIMIFYLSDL